MDHRYTASGILGLALLLVANAPGLAQSTTWTGGTGDWGTGSNWTGGEPTAGVDAQFNTAGTAAVSLSGETCRNLFFGTSGGNVVLNVTGGSLAVVHRIQLPVGGTGTINLSGGTVTADSLVMGAASSFGDFELSGGALTVGNAIVGTTAAAAGASLALSLGSPVLTVTHNLTLGPFADIVAGAGTISVGSTAADSLVVRGTFQMINLPTVATTNFVMRTGSVISATMLFNGITPVVSTGTVVLAGTLKVLDFGAPNGTYELIRGASMTGTFDGVQLPASGMWSWNRSGNSIFIIKGEVPVEPTTWSAIKAGLSGRP